MHRHEQSRPTGFEAAVFPNFTTPRLKIGTDRGNRTLMSFRPSAPRADVSTVPPRPHEKSGASTGTCALLSVLPRQSVAFYGLDAKWSKRKDSHLRSRSGRRVYSALHLLLCHASKEIGGSSGIRTRDRLLMRELRSLLRHRAKLVGRLGNAPSSAA